MNAARGIVWLALGTTVLSMAPALAKSITLEDRIAAQRAIEEVYWRHRLWPDGNAATKPSFDAAAPRGVIEARVSGYLDKSKALHITRAELQAELDRMTRDTRDPKLLQELFDALGNDADLIAETLARQTLAGRLNLETPSRVTAIGRAERKMTLNALPTTACTSDTWSPIQAAPAARHSHAAVWTGTEMIVWGGSGGQVPLNTGGRYNPATDSWTPTSLGPNVPSPVIAPSTVWTGTEMIVFGGADPLTFAPVNTGARYDPASDTWTPIASAPGIPPPRFGAAAVWTGTEMVVFGGGQNPPPGPNPAWRYEASTNTWSASSPAPATLRNGIGHAVWTGSEMILWGGGANTGARYMPSTDTWTETSTGDDVPSARYPGDPVWTGSQMISWGGHAAGGYLDSGGRYSPSTDSWQATSSVDAPSAREGNGSLWTGSSLLVWGGNPPGGPEGAVYDPAGDTWSAIAPSPLSSRAAQSVVWTGTQMIVFGGYEPLNYAGVNTGAVYCACPNGRLLYRDADGDGYGDPGMSRPSCDGAASSGYVVDATDCDDARAAAHPGGTDFDHDGQSDACDLDDGEIYVFGPSDKTHIEWQAERGPSSWNVYTGDLGVLRTTGNYTQSKSCGVVETSVADPAVPPPGGARFSLVAGVTGATETGLGRDGAGIERPNTNPCP